MEKVFYEAKPYLCLIVAIIALVMPSPPPELIVLSIVLIASGAWILRARWKVRSRGSEIEAAFYELQPYLYIATAIVAVIIQRGSKLIVGFSVILFIAAALILKMRKENRG